MTNYVGLDIGYSNFKMVYQCNGEPVRSILKPAGAAPLSRFSHTLLGKQENEGIVVVQLDGEDWVACIKHSQFEDSARVIDTDYSHTDTYMALYLSALFQTEAKIIDHLVTGLPVDQAYDKEFCNELIKRLEGEHQINKHITTTVKKVSVIPQPAGAYFNYLSKPDCSEEEVAESTILIVDPGFYSLDWFVMIEGQARKKSSGTTSMATSKIIEQVAAVLRMEYGGVNQYRVEDALRNDKKHIKISGQAVEIEPYFKKVIGEVAGIAVQEIANALRSEGEPDIILMAGGGAKFYTDEVRKKFKTKNFIGGKEESVLMNANGFLQYAIQS